jgi:hypothetical protein
LYVSSEVAVGAPMVRSHVVVARFAVVPKTDAYHFLAPNPNAYAQIDPARSQSGSSKGADGEQGGEELGFEC